MRAIGYNTPLPIKQENSLVDIDLARPSPSGRDLLVEIKAISVNPADTKVRANAQPEANTWRVLGWDAAGVIVEAGPEASLFKPGDEVFYAGSIVRPGTNAEFHLVDERIVGRKPKSLSFAQAAAMPLTSITAWELLFDRLAVAPGHTPDGRALLIIGGGGGVGSMLIQLARRRTALTVIATASRPLTRDWCLKLGARHVIDHSKPIPVQLKSVGHERVALIAGLTNTQDHLPDIIEVIAPQGRF